MLRLLFFILPFTIFAQQSLVNDINEVLKQAPSNTDISVLITNPVTGDTIFAKNITDEMIPASNTKLFTVAASLYFMGPEFEIPFKIMTDDFDFSDGIIDGNLILKGYGNPLLTNEILDSLVADLKELGITRITGKIIADDTYFDDVYTRDDWIVGEKANVNLPPVSAIVIDRNKFVVKLNSNKPVGSRLGASVIPNCSAARLNVTAKVTSGRKRPGIRAKFNTNTFTVNVSRGLKKYKNPRSYAVFAHDPPKYIKFLMKDKLEANAIIVENSDEYEGQGGILYELNSHQVFLKDLIKPINKNSDNFLAECLFKSLGAFYSEDQGNSFYATKAVNTFLEENFIEAPNTSLVDGSGISRFDKMSTAGVVNLLEYVYSNEKIFPHFFNSLSIAGVDGTLDGRLYNTIAYNNFRGKTGTLNGVSTLAGYVTSKSGEDIIVSIFMNFKKHGANFYRNLQDEIVELVAERL